jgi:hypothetical protein
MIAPARLSQFLKCEGGSRGGVAGAGNMTKVNLGFDAMRVEIRQKKQPGRRTGRAGFGVTVSRLRGSAATGNHFFIFRM